MDKHRAGHIRCKRVNQNNTDSNNAKHIYENMKCDVCHDPAAIVIETYRNVDIKEIKEEHKKRYEMSKRMYLCNKHINDLEYLLGVFKNS